jgi:hypothetical protein
LRLFYWSFCGIIGAGVPGVTFDDWEDDDQQESYHHQLLNGNASLNGVLINSRYSVGF